MRLRGVEECFRHATYRLVLAPADDATSGAQVQTRRTVGDGHQRGGSCVEAHLHERGPDSRQSWGGAEPQFGGIDLEQLATQPEKYLVWAVAAASAILAAREHGRTLTAGASWQ